MSSREEIRAELTTMSDAVTRIYKLAWEDGKAMTVRAAVKSIRERAVLHEEPVRASLILLADEFEAKL